LLLSLLPLLPQALAFTAVRAATMKEGTELEDIDSNFWDEGNAPLGCIS
jgi:hypothetical protein